MKKYYLLIAETLAVDTMVWALTANDARKAVARIGGREVYNAWAEKVIRERLAEGYYTVPSIAFIGEKWYDKIRTRTSYSDIIWTCKLIQERIGVVSAAIYPEKEV